MKWQCQSTAAAREVAVRFAREAFTPPRGIEKWNPDPEPADPLAPARALFTLVGEAHQWYEIVGTPPGDWAVTSKARAPARHFRVLVTEAKLAELRMLADWQLRGLGFDPASVTDAVLSTDYRPGAADASDEHPSEAPP